MDNTTHRYNQKCPECGGTDFVDDYAAGDFVCTSCALVLESHCIDERSEWRTFSDSDKQGADPNRVGAPSNPLLGSGDLSTVVGRTEGDGGTSYNLGRLNIRTNAADKILGNAFFEVSTMCNKLGLLEAIKFRACELYKDYKDLKSIKGRKAVAFYAACIYIACRLEGHPRTFKEINSAAPDASKKDIARCFRAVLNEMQDSKGLTMDVGTIHASNYMRRFGSQLGFTNDEMRACIHIANAAVPNEGRDTCEITAWDGRCPVSLAAAIIYMVSKLPKAKENGVETHLKEISRVTQVGEGTITSTCKELETQKDKLIPDWYLKSKSTDENTEAAAAAAAVLEKRNMNGHIDNDVDNIHSNKKIKLNE